MLLVAVLFLRPPMQHRLHLRLGSNTQILFFRPLTTVHGRSMLRLYGLRVGIGVCSRLETCELGAVDRQWELAHDSEEESHLRRRD